MKPIELVKELINYNEEDIAEAMRLAEMVYRTLGLSDVNIAYTVLSSLYDSSHELDSLSDDIVEEFLFQSQYAFEKAMENEEPNIVSSVKWELNPILYSYNKGEESDRVLLYYGKRTPIRTEEDVLAATDAYREAIEAFKLVDSKQFKELYQELQEKLSELSIEMPKELNDFWPAFAFSQIPDHASTKLQLVDLVVSQIKAYCEDNQAMVSHNIDRSSILNHWDDLRSEIQGLTKSLKKDTGLEIE